MLSELLARKKHRELQTEIVAEVCCIIISPAVGQKAKRKRSRAYNVTNV